jgi:hypothetical protein
MTAKQPSSASPEPQSRPLAQRCPPLSASLFSRLCVCVNLHFKHTLFQLKSLLFICFYPQTSHFLKPAKNRLFTPPFTENKRDTPPHLAKNSPKYPQKVHFFRQIFAFSLGFQAIRGNISAFLTFSAQLRSLPCSPLLRPSYPFLPPSLSGSTMRYTLPNCDF